MSNSDSMHPSEQIAKLLIEAMIDGARMQFRCRRDQSSRVRHDFDLKYPDGTVAAVEVTTSVPQQVKRTAARISNKKMGRRFVHAEMCLNSWWIHPMQGADDINKIRTHADEYLAAIEAEGRQFFTSYYNTSPAVARIWQELGIEGGYVMPCKSPNCIGIAFPSQGGQVSTEHFQRAIKAEADNNSEKLGEVAGVDERHLFVYIDPQNYLPWKALVGQHPPQQGPSLPPEITHVWAVAQTPSADKFVVWKAERGGNWQDLGVVVAPPPMERASN